MDHVISIIINLIDVSLLAIFYISCQKENFSQREKLHIGVIVIAICIVEVNPLSWTL